MPYVTDNALGIILLLASTVAVAMSAIANARHPQTGIGTGLALLAIGAILVWAVDIDLPYVADYLMGAILAVGGLAAVAAGVAAHLQRSRASRNYYGQAYRY